MTDRELVNEVCGKTVIPDPEQDPVQEDDEEDEEEDDEQVPCTFREATEYLDKLSMYLASVGIDSSSLRKLEKAMLQQHQFMNSFQPNITNFFSTPKTPAPTPTSTQKTPKTPRTPVTPLPVTPSTSACPPLVKVSSTPKGQTGVVGLKNYFNSTQAPTVKRKRDPKDDLSNTPKRTRAIDMEFPKTPLSPTPSTTSTSILSRVPVLDTLSVPCPKHVENRSQETDPEDIWDSPASPLKSFQIIGPRACSMDGVEIVETLHSDEEDDDDAASTIVECEDGVQDQEEAETLSSCDTVSRNILTSYKNNPAIMLEIFGKKKRTADISHYFLKQHAKQIGKDIKERREKREAEEKESLFAAKKVEAARKRAAQSVKEFRGHGHGRGHGRGRGMGKGKGVGKSSSSK